MRGFPPVQIFILGIVFGLLAWPLVQLTTGYGGPASAASGHGHDHDHDHDHSGHGGAEKEVKGGTDHPEGAHKHVEVPTVVRVRFAHRPLTLSLKQGNEELAAKADLSASPAEFRTELEVSHEGNELVVNATWPEGTPETAVTVELEPDGFESRSETRWSSGTTLDEVLTFKW